MQHRLVLLAAVAAAVLAFAVHAATIRYGFVGEDVGVVLGNPAAQRPLDLRATWLARSWAGSEERTTWRPLTTWTFALNHAVHGPAPLGYHLVNVAAHATAAAATTFLAAAVGLGAVAAAAAGALFAVHPIHADAVAAVNGRAVVLGGMLALVTLVLAARGAVLASALCALLALLAHEAALAILLLVPAALALGAPRKTPGARPLVIVGGVVLATLAYFALRWAALGSPGGRTPPSSVTGSLLDAGRLLMPRGIGFEHAAAAPTVLALVVGALVVGIAWWRGWPGVFWALVLFVGYGVAASGTLRGAEPFSDRLFYVAAGGFCALVAAALLTLPRGALAVVGGVAALALGGAWAWETLGRDRAWRDDMSVATALVESAPENATAQTRLGSAYAAAGNLDAALEAFGRALAIDPNHVAAVYNAGVVYQRQAKSLEALTAFRRAVDLDPSLAAGWINMAASNNRMGAFNPALGAADRAVALRPDLPNAHVVRGFALRGLQRPADAQAEFEEAVQLAPTNPDALMGLAVVAYEREMWPLAAETFERVVQVAPSPDAYRGLVQSYQLAGREQEAAERAAAARERYPDDPFFAPATATAPPAPAP